MAVLTTHRHRGIQPFTVVLRAAIVALTLATAASASRSAARFPHERRRLCGARDRAGRAQARSAGTAG